MLSTVRNTSILAMLYFIGDLVGAFLAIGDLFEATPGGFVLLSIAFLNALMLGAGVGAILGLILPARIRERVRLPRPMLGLLTVLVATSAYSLRVDRQVETLPARPELTATQAVPTLWIMIDTLRRDSLYDTQGVFSNAPHIGAWAQDTLIFDDVEATAGWTIPSLAALMTGVHNTTMDASAGQLPPTYQTVAEYLRQAGFQTHAIVDNVIVEPRSGFGQGFESFTQRSAFRFVFSLPSFRVLPRIVHDKIRSIWPTAYDGAQDVTDQAIARIHQTTENQAPLFLYVHYMDPHAPYYPHPDIAPDPADTEDVDYYHFRDVARSDVEPDITTPQLARLEHRYAGEIAYLDSHLHRLLQSWHARFGKDAMVMLTSDHGEEFLDHGHLGHGHTVHREIVNVPLLWQLPPSIMAAIDGDRVNHHPLSQIDILPTTLDVLGIQATEIPDTPAMQGQSWLPWLRQEAVGPTTPLVSSHGRHGRRTYRYRVADDVYIKTLFDSGRATEHQFYDLTRDPREQNELSQGDNGNLSPRFEDTKRAFEKYARSLKNAAPSQLTPELTPDQESLRAIGYIE
ncbi:MAG: sulfatase-like hydrolase/transferase [Myxococcota bacterium]|nr:sulfatase-like hydrolase/transferase [Myxococcota bacterium]